MKCNNCGSEDVVKASVAYEMGVTKSSGGAVGIGVVGGEPSLIGARTGGTSETLFAQRIKPPSNTRLELGCGGITFFAVFFGMVLLFNPPANNIAWAIILFGLPVLPAAWVYRTTKRQYMPERQAATATYDRKWVCLRCGEIGEADSFEAAASNRDRSNPSDQ